MTANKLGRSLVEYVRAKKREACAVCRIDDNIREQMNTAVKRKYSRETVLGWLLDDYGISLTHDELNAHQAAHHDRKELGHG